MKTQDIIEAMARLLNLDINELASAYSAFVSDLKAEASC